MWPLAGVLKEPCTQWLSATPVRCAAQLSAGIAGAVGVPADKGTALALPGNVTQADVADCVVAGVMLAAKSCGPPNALSFRRY